MITALDISRAKERIHSYLVETPLEYSPQLSKLTNGEVFLKLENQQVSGSFKARGAFNKILINPESIRKTQYYTAASTGNHGAAMATCIHMLRLRGKVYLPVNVSTSKLDFIAGLGVEYELYGQHCLHTELYARKKAEENGYILVPPYNDPVVIAGQGTIGLEMLRQNPALDTIVVPVGGGGMMSGIASYVKEMKPSVKLWGCQPESGPEMVASIEAGKIIEEDISQPTLSDATAGGLEPGSMTFEICRSKVDEWSLINEDDLAKGILWILKHHQMVIEGSAALPIGWLLRDPEKFAGKKVGIVIGGKRISYMKLRSLMCRKANMKG